MIFIGLGTERNLTINENGRCLFAGGFVCLWLYDYWSTQKMLSSNWLQNFQYNHNEPGHGRLLSKRKARLLTVHQFVQAGFVCLFGLKAVIHSLFDTGIGLDLTKRGYRN